MAEDATTTKGGRIQIQTGFYRTSKGLTITVKAAPEVEAFFVNTSAGVTQPVGHFGRLWQATGEKPLEVYQVPQVLAETTQLTVNKSGRKYYTFSGPGGHLLVSMGNVDDCINLSLLRLVGISEGAGVEFRIKNAIYSLPMLKNIRDFYAEAQREFYINYMRPVDLTVSVSTQEI